MADPSFREPLKHQVLPDDFSHGQVAVKSAQPSGAEDASHWTADLGADAAAYAVFVWEQDALENLVVAVVNEQLLDSIACFEMGSDVKRSNYELFRELVSKGSG